MWDDLMETYEDSVKKEIALGDEITYEDFYTLSSSEDAKKKKLPGLISDAKKVFRKLSERPYRLRDLKNDSLTDYITTDELHRLLSVLIDWGMVEKRGITDPFYGLPNEDARKEIIEYLEITEKGPIPYGYADALIGLVDGYYDFIFDDRCLEQNNEKRGPKGKSM